MLTNVAQMCSLIVWPFSRKAFRRWNRECANAWWDLSRWWTEDLYGITIEILGDDVPDRENAIVICNHQCMTDIVTLWSIAKPKHRLGDMKFAVKDALKYVPGLGWGMLFLDCLFLKRNWEEDERKVRATFDKFRRFQIPIWLVSFSEGTRLTKRKLEAAQKFAEAKGLPVPQNVLLPRTKGFVAAVHGLRDYATAVYDITLAYPEGVPTVWQLVQGRMSRNVLHVKRYPIESIPKEKGQVAEWLLARFREKDILISQLQKR